MYFFLQKTLRTSSQHLLPQVVEEIVIDSRLFQSAADRDFDRLTAETGEPVVLTALVSALEKDWADLGPQLTAAVDSFAFAKT